MQDMTLGIIGFGKIGQAVARRARGFGVTIVAYDPYADHDAATDLGVQLRDLPTLLAETDRAEQCYPHPAHRVLFRRVDIEKPQSIGKQYT